MDDQSGVTRDRHYGHAEWQGTYFTVIDTGGYVSGSDDVFEAQIREQVELAIEEADVVLFVVDAHVGMHPLDEEFAKQLRRFKKPSLLVANKADTGAYANSTGEFYALGMGDVFPISAQNGSGTGDLLDKICEFFPDDGVEDPDAGIPRIAILGRPNVGKSSFVNTLLGKNRSIVTNIAGTTRDSIDARYKAYGKEFILTDTAGLRRKAKVNEDIEFYSVLRSVRALERSDIIILMLDAQQGMESQDLKILSMAIENNKGVLILVNKWDLVENKTSKTTQEFEKQIRESMHMVSYLPIMFISVQEKQRIFQAIEKAIHIFENMKTKIPTSELNNKLLPEIEYYPPPATKGKHIQIKYITQLPTKSVSFAFFCNLPQYIKDPYKRFLENKLREHFDFEGIPINIVCKNK
jgi:GTP-binding protein